MLRWVGTYERTVGASLDRAWENVRDWEHLPWLHAASFRSIEVIEQGRAGWRARIGLHPGDEIVLELAIDGGGDRYVARTLEGPQAGSEIWTTLSAVQGERYQTDVLVEFHLPDIAEESVPAVGAAYHKLYARLWDEDEAMMRSRESALARRLMRPEVPAVRIELGSLDALRRQLPLVVDEGGRRVRVLEHGGRLVAHDAVCPHWLGPLDEADNAGGELVCPWHGYRFSLHDGASCEGRRLHLSPPPRVEIDDDRGTVALVWAPR
jgi:nitrite reductase/ring-hydroxylating ferredoxin subunit